MLKIKDLLKKDVKIEGNFVNYSNKNGYDIETDRAASWRWEHSVRLENDPAFVSHQFNDFLQRYGFLNEDDFVNFLKDKKTIAEIGAGEGRLVDWYLKYSNAHVFAVDISDSVNYLREKYKDNLRVTVIKADALYHPFADSSIDLLSCEQSISNASNPAELFFSLIKAIHPASNVIVSVLAAKSLVREKMDYVIRDSISKYSAEEKDKISDNITKIGKLLSEMNVNVSVPDNFLEFGNLKGKEMSIQKFFYFAVFKCFYNEKFTFEKSKEFNYDWYCYPVCNKFTLAEVSSWFIKENIKIDYIDCNDSNINLRGTR